MKKERDIVVFLVHKGSSANFTKCLCDLPDYTILTKKEVANHYEVFLVKQNNFNALRCSQEYKTLPFLVMRHEFSRFLIAKSFKSIKNASQRLTTTVVEREILSTNLINEMLSGREKIILLLKKLKKVKRLNFLISGGDKLISFSKAGVPFHDKEVMQQIFITPRITANKKAINTSTLLKNIEWTVALW
jgi:hypothetical protein